MEVSTMDTRKPFVIPEIEIIKLEANLTVGSLEKASCNT